MSAATIDRGIVTIDGRDYATPAVWADIKPGTTAVQVRRAAADGANGLAAAAIPMSPGGKIKAYPVDLLEAWEAERGDGPGKGQPVADCRTVAKRLKVSKMRVWRAVNAGLIKAARDEFGRWELDAVSVEQWQAAGMPGPRAHGHD